MLERPVYQLAHIEDQRERIRTALSGQFDGQLLQGELFATFVEAVRALLPRTLGRDAVFESCRALLGSTFTPQVSLLFAWRLAGNMATIRAGRPVHPWSCQRQDEWVPLHVLRGVRTRNRYNLWGTDYTFRVLAGTPAGLRVTAFWKASFVRLAAFKMGFSKPKGKYPLRNAVELVGLRLYGLLDREKSTQSPNFYEIDCPASLAQWNREQVLKMRSRVYPCPQSFNHACFRCAIGYLDCPAGTHRRTFYTGFCNICGNAEAVFDPEENSPHCIDCTFKERTRRNA